MVPTTNREQPWLAVNLQTVDIQEARSGANPIAIKSELTIYYEVLRHIKYRQYVSEPLANLGVASLDATRRPVIEMSIGKEYGVEQLPVEAVDGRGVTRKKVVHTDPISHGNIFGIHSDEATSITARRHVGPLTQCHQPC